MNRTALLIPVYLAMAAFLLPAQEDFTSRARELARQLDTIRKLGGDHLKYTTHALEILRRGFGITPEGYRPPPGRQRFRFTDTRTEVDVYSLLSGGLAIRESLQLDRLIALRPGRGAVDVSTLKPPSPPSHPFEKMLEGRQWKASGLAKIVPHDFYYATFRSMAACLDFADYLDEVGGLVLRRYAPTSVDFHVKEKVLTQLALRVTKKARKFYDAVIDEMAVVGSDPFLREGADVTLIYKLKSPTVFKMSIGLYRKYFEVTHGAETREETIRGLTVHGLVTPDRTVNAWLVHLAEDRVVISTSRRALERVIATHQGECPSLHDQHDFRYMRSIYPAEKGAEDGFLYLSDAFIRHLVGPELRIKEARRMAEAMRIAALERYVILFYQLHGRLPKSVEEVFRDFDRTALTADQKKRIEVFLEGRAWNLVKDMDESLDLSSWDWYRIRVENSLWNSFPGTNRAGVERRQGAARKIIAELKALYMDLKEVEPETPREVLDLIEGKYHPGKSSGFRDLDLVASTFSALSRTYGRLGFFRPNLENEVKAVSDQEAKAYQEFVAQYERYWRTYFDPIGLRIRSDKTRRIEVCILPLIQNSVYDMLQTVFGGKAVALATHPLQDEIVSLGLKVGRDAPPLEKLPFLREMQDELNEGLQKELGLETIDFLSILGDSLEIHAMDIRPLVDFDAGFLLREILPDFGRRNPEMAAYIFLAFSLFHPLRVSVGVREEKEAEAFLEKLDRILAVLDLKGDVDMDLSSYGFEHEGHTIRVLKMSVMRTLHFRLFYAVHGGMLHITTTEDHLKKVLDAGERSGSKPVEANLLLQVRPDAMQLERPVFERTVAEAAMNASLRNLGTLRLLSLLFPDEKNLARKCWKTFGFEPISPAGGNYLVDPVSGTVSDSVFGTRENPRLDVDGIRTAVGMTRFFSTRRITLALRFTPEGIMSVIEIH